MRIHRRWWISASACAVITAIDIQGIFVGHAPIVLVYKTIDQRAQLLKHLLTAWVLRQIVDSVRIGVCGEELFDGLFG